MTALLGRPDVLQDPSHLLTECASDVQTIGSADILMSALFNCGVARRLRIISAGTLLIRRRLDGGGRFVPYTVVANEYIDGYIIVVGGSTSGSSSGLQFIAEH